MTRNPSPDRFPGLLAAAAMGVYLLLLVGATTAVTDAASACAAWPACGDGWTLPATGAGALALGHRLAAVAVGLVVATVAVLAWRDRTRRPRVRAALALAALLYPAQAALGAVVAISPESRALTAAHLGLGLAIFGGILAALAWTLERATGDPDDDPEIDPSDLAPDLPPAPADDRLAVPDDRVARLRATLGAYVRLTKPRLMWLLCLVAGAAMALAGGTGLTPRVVAATLGGGVLAIGASGTFNHVLERDVDRRMSRTSDRPLAVDLIPVGHAVAFGLVLALGSLALFATINLLAAALGLAAIVYYSVVYTLVLKPNTAQNTVIGGFAGSFPALIGAAAAANTIGPAALLLGALIFLWTPAHFYNLALVYREDYERGGVPMFPVVRGEEATRTHILAYLGATLVATAVLAAVAGLGVLYAVTAVAFGALFLWAVVALHRRPSRTTAWRAFHASNAYLGAILVAIVVDGLVL